MRERLGELHPLAHAVREPAHRPVGGILEPDRLERGRRRGAMVGDAVQLGGELDHPAGGEERPRRAVVGDDADAPVDVGGAPRVRAEDPHRAAARRGEAGTELERGRLAGAVVAEQADHPAVGRERDVRQGDRVAEPARHRLERDRGGGVAHPVSRP